MINQDMECIQDHGRKAVEIVVVPVGTKWLLDGRISSLFNDVTFL